MCSPSYPKRFFRLPILRTLLEKPERFLRVSLSPFLFSSFFSLSLFLAFSLSSPLLFSLVNFILFLANPVSHSIEKWFLPQLRVLLRHQEIDDEEIDLEIPEFGFGEMSRSCGPQVHTYVYGVCLFHWCK